MLSVRIRVMASGFFLLQRFFLRVDDVLFRIRDTRMYHAFGTGEIVREYCEREAGYEEVKAHLGKGKDGISKLADAGWVSDQIPEVALLQESMCVLE
jgi:type 2A phosphatase activator TIP41